ncbi:tetraspanin-9-like [Uranotaenia lowii]|uniref:tetraspanin-9-like n=1 Tax=Uranotaenia lowii TaxID=190385 RepID=UPI00247B275A|nr:tetraspanin-9-like [Uranotaenia lowii]
MVPAPYFLMSFLLFVVLFLGCILGFVFRGRIVESLRDSMYISLMQYGRRRMLTVSWDMTQEELQCCGVQDFGDWGEHIPDSCCMDDYGGRKRPCQQLQTSHTIYREGCFSAITKDLVQSSALMGAAGLGLAFSMIPGLVMSYYLLTVV